MEKLTHMRRNATNKSPLRRVASRLEALPPLELLKAVTPAHLRGLSSAAALENTPIALIPDTLGRAQTRVSHSKELRRVDGFHKRRARLSIPSIPRLHSKSNLHSFDSSKSSHRRRCTSLSAKLLPSRTRRSASVRRQPSFLSYLLEKSVSFESESSSRLLSIRNSVGILPSPYRSASRSPVKARPESPSEVLSFSGLYHDGLPEGQGEAKYRSGDSYSGEWSKGQRHGAGEYFYRRLDTSYSGEWQQGLKHGRGVLTFSNGDKLQLSWDRDCYLPGSGRVEYVSLRCEYSGELQGASRHGAGKMRYSTGAQYEGAWVNDCRHGAGVIRWPEGHWFEGSFEQDEASAPGLLLIKNALVSSAKHSEFLSKVGGIEDFPQFATKSDLSPRDVVWRTLKLSDVPVYFSASPPISQSGTFSGGCLSGFGLAAYGSFGVYVGEFLSGKRHGYGRMTYTNQHCLCLQVPESDGEYIGQWRKDQRHGWGCMRWTNGLVYEGVYRKDHRHMVTGILRFPGGESYEGLWGRDLMQGAGRWRDGKGSVFQGNFSSGCPALEGRLDLPDGGHYEGSVRSLLPHGSGRYAYPSGDVYIGEFLKGLRCGRGKMTYQDGSEYDGEWKDNEREGWGRYRSAEEVYEGGWSRDRRNGVGVLRDLDGRVMFEGLWRNGVKEGRGVQSEDA